MKKNNITFSFILLSIVIIIGLLVPITALAATTNNNSSDDLSDVTDEAYAGKQIELEFYQQSLSSIYGYDNETGAASKYQSELINLYPVISLETGEQFVVNENDFNKTNYFLDMSFVTIYQATMMAGIDFNSYVVEQAKLDQEVYDACIGTDDINSWTSATTIFDIDSPYNDSDGLTGIEEYDGTDCYTELALSDDIRLETYRSLYEYAYLAQPYDNSQNANSFDYNFTQYLYIYEPALTWSVTQNNFNQYNADTLAWRTYNDKNIDSVWNEEVNKSNKLTNEREKIFVSDKVFLDGTSVLTGGEPLLGFDGVKYLGSGDIIGNANATESVSGPDNAYIPITDDQYQIEDPTATDGPYGFANPGNPHLVASNGTGVAIGNGEGTIYDSTTFIGSLIRAKSLYPYQDVDTNEYQIIFEAEDASGTSYTNLFEATGLVTMIDNPYSTGSTQIFDDIRPIFYLADSFRKDKSTTFIVTKEYFKDEGYYIELTGDLVIYENYIDPDLIKKT